MIASHELVSVLYAFHLINLFFLKTCHVPQVCVLVNTYSKEWLEQLQVFIADITNYIDSSF